MVLGVFCIAQLAAGLYRHSAAELNLKRAIGHLI